MEDLERRESAAEVEGEAVGWPRGPASLCRFTLAWRLALTLGAMAAVSTVLAVAAQDRALARDLQAAAEQRLERATRSAQHVVRQHLSAVHERYRAVGSTPQVRATLEVGDAPTLRFLARELAAEHGAALVAFVGDAGEPLALHRLDDELALDAVLAAITHGPSLLAFPALRSRPFAAVSIPLETGGRSFGALVALEEVAAPRLASWSMLCGADLFVTDRVVSTPDRIVRPVLPLGREVLAAAAGLEAERMAVSHARRDLLRAGGLALLVALVGCFAVTRSLVRPIGAIQRAVERMRRGDLSIRVASRRGDEIGDVARGVDLMAEELGSSRTALHAQMAKLHRSQEHLANAQRIARVGSFDVDLQSFEVTGSEEFWTLLGFDPEAAAAKSPEPGALLERIHPEDRSGFEATLQDCLRSGHAARLDHRVVIAEAAARVFHTQLRVLRAEEQRAARLEGTVQDVTERRRAEEQIRFLAYHDGLTGLGNRRQFKQRVEIAIAQVRRRGRGLGILFLDLDHFKRINDTLGHSVGDEVLQGVADRIVASVRQTDFIARGEDTNAEIAVSRLGGDEFTVLLDDIEDPSQLAAISRRILDGLQHPFAIRGHELVVGASIGIATWPQDGSDLETLLRNADAAMYHAKSSGRNTYQYYEQSMNAAAVRRLTVETRLRQAIEQAGIEVHYQPQISLETGHTTGFEALSRWRDEELGVVSPGEFVSIAEQTGLIVPLGRSVLRRACAQASSMVREFPQFEGRISVNASARQFRASDLVHDVAQALDDTRLNPRNLEIEITESVVLHDEAGVVETLRALRDMGVSVALDDFGTGYSSLSYLRHLPVDTLKIDMSFVRAIMRSSQDAALARAIVAMGAALGLSVVAEGVETEEQRALLQSWGCDEMQGFLISPALPPAEAVSWLRCDR